MLIFDEKRYEGYLGLMFNVELKWYRWFKKLNYLLYDKIVGKLYNDLIKLCYLS